VAISFFALQGFIFLVTQYFQFIKAFSPLGTGIRLLPVATAVAVASVAGTKLAVRVGNKVIVASGLLFFAAGTLWTATVSASTPYATIALQMLILGTGMGLTSAPATEAIMGAVPKAGQGTPATATVGRSCAPGAQLLLGEPMTTPDDAATIMQQHERHVETPHGCFRSRP
jgi:hypothetical protein